MSTRLGHEPHFRNDQPETAQQQRNHRHLRRALDSWSCERALKVICAKVSVQPRLAPSAKTVVGRGHDEQACDSGNVHGASTVANLITDGSHLPEDVPTADRAPVESLGGDGGRLRATSQPTS